MNNPSPLEAIFFAALEKGSPQERAAYLDEACAGDPGLRRRVEKMVAAQAQAGSFLEQPAHSLVMTVDEQPVSEAPGTIIGSYKLLEQIGEGGFGIVFMAEQLQPVRRKVALKLLKPGMDTRQVVARFEAERQALALMDHPHIAKIHDGGTTAAGRPYFVMELVRGVPLTEFCDQRRLTPRQRLELFVQVCQAVQHAHQKGIIHRDLKPTNVLVTLHDTVAVPKVIDFGIAKAVGQQLSEHTLFTHFAQLVGTPLYMSPEQAEMNGLDVDTRSDVYSLGVLLYELLTGTTPFESETLKKAGLDEMRRLIREEEPPRPSHRVNTLGAEACSTVSERRGVDGRQLHQLLRGELDWIIMKALEKDRNRRYESASALAADVQRYLDDEAVEACPPSKGYRLRKFVRRNRRALVTAGVIALVLVAATAVSAWKAVVARDAQRQAEADARRAEIAEQKAVTEAAIATAVNQFLQVDLLRQVNSAPVLGEGSEGTSNLTVREALDRAAARIGERFQDQPLVEAAIRMAIGRAYSSVGGEQRALPHLRRAVELRNVHLGPDHEETLAAMDILASACSWTGQHTEAIALRQQLLKKSEAVHGPSQSRTLTCLGNLAGAYQLAGHWDKSTRLREQLLEKRRAINGPTHPETLTIMQSLADDYTNLGRLPEALGLYEAVLEIRKARTSPESHVLLLLSYAYACQQAGKLNVAEKVLREVLECTRKRTDSLGQIATANTLGWLARTLLLNEQFADAEPLVREAVAIFEKEQPNSTRRFYWVSVLGGVLLAQRKYAEAEPLLLQGYEGIKQREAVSVVVARERMAEVVARLVRFYEETGQPEEARLWRDRLAMEKKPTGFVP